MLDLYTTIVFLSSFVLIITAAGVITNRLVSKKNKSEIVVLCLLIGIAILGEWIGVETNGADASFILLHKIAKLVEFCVAPAIGVMAAVVYGLVKKKKTIAIVLISHAAFEILALFNNWVFRVDSKNVYHREKLYWIYIVTFALSVVYCFVCIKQGNKKWNGII